MRVYTNGKRCFIDERPYHTTQQMSFDLSQHLPRRLSVGPALVITDNPPIFLSVIRKRLAKQRAEIHRQLGFTLDRDKREMLSYEVRRLNTYRFTARTPKRIKGGFDARFMLPEDVEGVVDEYPTVYIATTLSAEEFASSFERVAENGVFVVYIKTLEDSLQGLI